MSVFEDDVARHRAKGLTMAASIELAKSDMSDRLDAYKPTRTARIARDAYSSVVVLAWVLVGATLGGCALGLVLFLARLFWALAGSLL